MEYILSFTIERSIIEWHDSSINLYNMSPDLSESKVLVSEIVKIAIFNLIFSLIK